MTLGMDLQPQYIIMTTEQNSTVESINFLKWLKTRLYFKHKDQDPQILSGIENIIEILEPKPFIIDKKKIMKICKKNYAGFNFDKDESSVFDIGYSKKDKIEILNHVTKIITEYYGHS